MKQLRKGLLWVLLVAGLGCLAQAQEDISNRSFTLTKINFQGLKTIATDQAMAGSGLQTGQTVKVQHLKDAAQRMLDRGIFRAARLQYKYVGDALEVTFTVEENITSLPCLFDNFPWFTNEEIQAAIRRDLPNFDGKATEGGEMVETIRQSLTKLLRENNIAGRVETEMAGLGAAHMFKLEEVKLPICAINFDGVAAFDESHLRGVVQELFQVEYSRSINNLIVRDTVIPLYRQKGYLKVRLKQLQGAFNKEGDAKCKDKVSVLIPLEEGASYKWNEPVWSGNELLTTEMLNRRILLKAGEVADGVKIDKGIAQVSLEYQERGYFGLRLNPQPQFDETARTVTFRFTITEGQRYKIGSLTLTGANAARGQKLKEQWATIEGQPFERSLLRTLLEKSSVSGRNVSLSNIAEHEKLLVNVTVEIN